MIKLTSKDLPSVDGGSVSAVTKLGPSCENIDTTYKFFGQK